MEERLRVPLFKIVQRPLLPVWSSWVDAAPFVAMCVLLAGAAYFAYRGKRIQLARRGMQLASAFFFIIFFHQCLCVLRGWIWGIQSIGRNNLTAFADLFMVVIWVGFTAGYGRLFCGWICPLALMQEAVSFPARIRLSLNQRKERYWVGYLIPAGLFIFVVWLAYLLRPGTQFFVENVAAVWVFALLVVLFIAVALEGKDVFLRHVRYPSAGAWVGLAAVGIFVTYPWCVLMGDELDYSALIALVGLIAASSVIPLAWCRYVCPAAGPLELLARLSPFRIRNHKECTRCGECTALCPTGALEPNRIDHSQCIYCGKCLGKCGFAWEEPKQ